MQFRGRLRLPDDAQSGIPVELVLDDIFVVLKSETEVLGEWRMDDVGITRAFSNQFLLDLDGEEMVFIADDPLGFAYEGMTAIDETSERLSKRRRFRKKKSKPERHVRDIVDSDRAEAERAKEQRSKRAEPSVISGESGHPTEAPLGPVTETQWAASAPASSIADEPALEASAPVSHVETPVELPHQTFETSTERLPERLETPTEPETPAMAPAAHEPLYDTEVKPVYELPDSGALEPLEDQPEPVVIEEPEFEIEEVMASATAAFIEPSARDAKPERTDEPADQASTTLEEAEEELIVEEVAAISSSADVAFANVTEESAHSGRHSRREASAPLQDEEPSSVEEDFDVDEEPADDVADGALEPLRPPVESGLVPTPDPFAVEDEQDRQAAEEPILDAPRAGDEAVPSSNGGLAGAGRIASAVDAIRAEGPEHEAEVAERGVPDHQRGRLRRRRRREETPHEHRYDEKSAVGGIIRRVCAECGHVSFGSEDVYEPWS